MKTDQDLYEEINNFLPTVLKIVIVGVSAANLGLSGSFCALPVYACAYII